MLLDDDVSPPKAMLDKKSKAAACLPAMPFLWTSLLLLLLLLVLSMSILLLIVLLFLSIFVGWNAYGSVNIVLFLSSYPCHRHHHNHDCHILVVNECMYE